MCRRRRRPARKKRIFFGRGGRELRCGEGSTGWLLCIGTERVAVSLLFFQDGRRRGPLSSLPLPLPTQMSSYRQNGGGGLLYPKKGGGGPRGVTLSSPLPVYTGVGGSGLLPEATAKEEGGRPRAPPRFLHSQGGRREGLGRGSPLAIHFFFWDFYAREKDSGEEEEEEEKGGGKVGGRRKTEKLKNTHGSHSDGGRRRSLFFLPSLLSF